jgi:Fe-S cluster assembly ATP-binding protein
MLKITNLSASIGDKQILNNINLELSQGKCLLITGQNGAGKSTLLHAIMGRPDITTTGLITLDASELDSMECHERAKSGVFLAHQAPPTIDGVDTMTLLNEINKVHDMPYTKGELISQASDKFLHMQLPDDWKKRPFNNGASGGERKKNELVQAQLFKKKTKLLLLDEPDSGLEQSSRQKIIELIEATCLNGGSVLLVTHDKELQEKYNDNKLDLSNA